MRRLASFVLAGTMALAIAGPASAQPDNDVAQGVLQNALIGVIVQAAVQDVEVVVLNNSLNNLLRNADIDVNVLNNSLNNVLQNVDIDISDIDILSPGGDLILNVAILGDGVVVTLP